MMKLRIKGNSVRLRLLRGEVAEFGRTGKVTEATNFGAAKFGYTLEAADINEIKARFTENQITVFVPDAAARDWVESDQITLSAEQKIGDNESLKILVEKDFVCLDRPNDEDNRDAYPNLSHKCR